MPFESGSSSLSRLCRRVIAGMAPRAERDKLALSLMEMFAWALDGGAPLVFVAAEKKKKKKEFPICV